MKEIIKYIAKDNTEFYKKQECEDYENLIDTVNKIIIKLYAKPKEIEFSNGHGFIQHDKQKALEVRTQLLMLIKDKVNHKWITDSIEKPEETHISYACRLIDDYSSLRPVSIALNRFYCMDNQYREWGQPFFAMHPEEGENIKLN